MASFRQTYDAITGCVYVQYVTTDDTIGCGLHSCQHSVEVCHYGSCIWAGHRGSILALSQVDLKNSGDRILWEGVLANKLAIVAHVVNMLDQTAHIHKQDKMRIAKEHACQV
jgi:hypothetical protein